MPMKNTITLTNRERIRLFSKRKVPQSGNRKKPRIINLNKRDERMHRKTEKYVLECLKHDGNAKEIHQYTKEMRYHRKIRKIYADAFRLEEIDGTIFYIFKDNKAFQKLMKACDDLIKIAEDSKDVKADKKLFQKLKRTLPGPGHEDYIYWQKERGDIK